MSRPGVHVGVEQREPRVGRAGRNVTGISCAFGDVSEQVLSVGSSATVPAVTAAGTRPRAVAVNGTGVAERHAVRPADLRRRRKRNRPNDDRDAHDVALVAGQRELAAAYSVQRRAVPWS